MESHRSKKGWRRLTEKEVTPLELSDKSSSKSLSCNNINHKFSSSKDLGNKSLSFRSLKTEEEYYAKELSAANKSLLENEALARLFDMNKNRKKYKKELSLMSQNALWQKSLKCSKSFHLLKNNMKFGKSKSNNNNNKVMNDIRNVSINPLTPAERRLYRNKLSHWKSIHGKFINTETINKVTKREYLQYYESFSKLSKLNKNNKMYLNLQKLCKYLGINTNMSELKKIVDILDKDGNNDVEFGEYVLQLKKMKLSDSELYIGAGDNSKQGLTLDLLLLSYNRRSILNDIISKSKDNLFIDSFAGPLYQSDRNKFISRGRGLYKCHICKEEFEYTNELNDHILSVHKYNYNYYTCYFCGEKWIPINNKKKHELLHKMSDNSNKQTNGFKCNICDVIFSSRKILSHHIKENHTPLKLNVFECILCGDEFLTQNEKQNHIKKYHSYKKRNKSNIKKQKSVKVTQSETPEIEYEEFSGEEFTRMQDNYFRNIRAKRERNFIPNKIQMFKEISEFRINNKNKGENIDQLQKAWQKDKKDKINQDSIDYQRAFSFGNFDNMLMIK